MCIFVESPLLCVCSNQRTNTDIDTAFVSTNHRSQQTTICHNIYPKVSDTSVTRRVESWKYIDDGHIHTYVIGNRIFTDIEAICVRYKTFRVRRNESREKKLSKMAQGTECDCAALKCNKKKVGRIEVLCASSLTAKQPR